MTESGGNGSDGCAADVTARANFRETTDNDRNVETIPNVALRAKLFT